MNSRFTLIIVAVLLALSVALSGTGAAKSLAPNFPVAVVGSTAVDKPYNVLAAVQKTPAYTQVLTDLGRPVGATVSATEGGGYAVTLVYPRGELVGTLATFLLTPNGTLIVAALLTQDGTKSLTLMGRDYRTQFPDGPPWAFGPAPGDVYAQHPYATCWREVYDDLKRAADRMLQNCERVCDGRSPQACESCRLAAMVARAAASTLASLACAGHLVWHWWP